MIKPEQYVIAVVLGILTVTFLITLYNVGYLIAAKLLGFRLEVFSIGFGPEIIHFDLGKTRYEIRRYLIGGRVTHSGTERGLRRLLFLLGGPAAVFLFGCLCTFLYLMNGFTAVVPHGAVIVEVVDPATNAILRHGDLVTMVNSQVVRDGIDLASVLSRCSNMIDVTFCRQSQTNHVVLARNVPDKFGRRMGFGILFESQTQRENLEMTDAVRSTPAFVLRALGYTLDTFATLFRRPLWSTMDYGTNGPKQLSITVEFVFVALITLSIGLGALHLLPLPHLPGSQIALGIFELVFRNAVNPHVLGIAQAAQSLAVVLLIGSMLWVAIANGFQSRPPGTYLAPASVLKRLERNPTWSF
jgi:regulator of sigma E protease